MRHALATLLVFALAFMAVLYEHIRGGMGVPETGTAVSWLLPLLALTMVLMIKSRLQEAVESRK
jgi:hypothetical protein